LPFCTNCGKPSDPSFKYCGFCGASLAAFENLSKPAQQSSEAPASAVLPPPPPDYRPPSTYQQPANYQQPQAYPQAPISQQPVSMQPTKAPQGTSEMVLGVILVRKPKSLGRSDMYTAVVTNQRMIFALLTNEMLKQAAQMGKEKAKAEGKGFWGQMQDQFRGWYYCSQRYLTMDPSAALSENPLNFAINSASINEIKLRLVEIDPENATQCEFEMELESTQGKNKFRMTEKDEYPNLLRQAYGEKVKLPFGYSSRVKVKLF
jgi:hypothetical protein